MKTKFKYYLQKIMEVIKDHLPVRHVWSQSNWVYRPQWINNKLFYCEYKKKLDSRKQKINIESMKEKNL